MAKLSWFALLLTLALPARPAQATKCPNMYVILDRSGSMRDNGKWDAAKTAIKAFTEGELVSGGNRVARQRILRFGLMLFPTGEQCGSGTNQVSCEFYRATAIGGALSATSPGGATPTGESLGAAKLLTDLKDVSRRKFVILVTDGAPTCAPDSDGTATTVASQNYAVQQVQALRSTDPTLDVKTFVVGFGAGVEPGTLDRMAEAGGTARVNAAHKYYEATDAASLGAVFDAIATVAAGELGTGLCDDSCHVNGCPQGQRCVGFIESFPGGATMNLGRCEADPCYEKTCGAGEFCRDGTCIPACAVTCPSGQICRDGQCASDPCALTGCPCTPGCQDKLICQEGTCVDDPCRNIRCPIGTVCVRGSCAADPYTGHMDAGIDDTPGTDAGSGKRVDAGTGVDDGSQGCTCATGAGAPAGALGLAAIMLGLLRRRRA